MKHKYIIELDGQLYGVDYSDEDHLLFVFMGHTLTEIQVFELHLCIQLSAMMQDSKAKADFEESMKTNTSKTLGQIAQMVKTYLKDDELSELLINIKNKRNYFIHGFLQNYGWPMMSAKQYSVAIKEMEDFQQQLKLVHEKLAKHIVENKLAKIGFATISKDGELKFSVSNTG